MTLHRSVTKPEVPAGVEEAAERLGSCGLSVERGTPLAGLGTFQLGGPAGAVVRVEDPSALAGVRKILRECGAPSVLIGEGSNLLFADEGWPGVVVRFVDGAAEPVELEAGCWRVSAAMNLDRLSAIAAKRGWAGMEAFTGIPGTVGGAVVGNAGAWGVQMEHVVTEVETVTPGGAVKRLRRGDCGFAYRDSSIKHSGAWVASVEIRLDRGGREALWAERERILAERAARHPDWRKVPCIGSFFRNLEPTSRAERRRAAGWFLESAGVKAFCVGGAGVYEGHANIPVKRTEACRAAEVAELARRMRAAVREAHGVELRREVRYLGEIPGEEPAAGFY